MVSTAVRVLVLVVAIIVVILVFVVVTVVFVVIAGSAGASGSITGGGDGGWLLLLGLEMAHELMLVMVTRSRLQVQSVCVVQRGDVVMAANAVVDVGVQM